MIAKPMAITIPSKTPSVISRPKSLPSRFSTSNATWGA
jgi:hypothetical protein